MNNSSNSVVEPEPYLLAQDTEFAPNPALFTVLMVVAQKRRAIGLFTISAFAAGVLLSVLLPARFTARTTIMTPQQTQSTAAMLMSQLASSGAAPLAAAASGTALGLKSPNDLYIGLLQSRPVYDGIIHQFGLQALYHTKDLTGTRKRLAENIAISSERSGLISISVTDRDRTRAAAMANGFTDQLRVLTKRLAVTEAAQRRLFYEEQLRIAKDELVSAEFAFQQVQQNKGMVQPDAQARAMIEGLAMLHAQITAKQVEIQALRSFSTERNPELELAEHELASLQAEATSLRQKGHSSGFGDMGLQDVPQAGLEYLRAEHEAKTRQALFDLLVRQYDAARLDEAKDAAVIQVVEPAIPPERKSSPRRLFIILAFSFVALIGSSGFFCLLDHLRRRPGFTQSIADLRSVFRGN